MKHILILSAFLAISIFAFSQKQPLIGKNKDVTVVNSIETESNLPLILINTSGNEILDDPRIVANMKVINNESGVNKTTDPGNEYDGDITIEIRGSSSQMFDQKSYTLETIYNSDSNINVALLGMPKDNDWILHGPYTDKSLMRNALAYYLGNQTEQWAPRTRFCEVYINDEYRGVYVLIEKIKRDNNRLDIPKLNPDEITGDDLTGGYILKIDRPDYGAWTSPYKGLNGWSDIYISYVEPEYEDMPNQQLSYIKNYVTDFENALSGPDFKSEQIGFRAYIDERSFIDLYLINEISRNVDGYRLSTFFYKDKDSNGGKLTMGPLWDFNLGFGNADYYDGAVTEGWIADGVSEIDESQIPFWWGRLREDPYYEANLKHRWEELRNDKFSDDNIENFIDSCADLLNIAQERHYDKYQILDMYIWPNAYIGYTYENEVDYLKQWVLDRAHWMDQEIDYINGIEELVSVGIQISAYPNPFTESVTLGLTLDKNVRGAIIIQNILGEQIYSDNLNFTPGKNEYILDKTIFKEGTGIYFYEIKIENNSVISGKLIKK